MPQHNIHQVKLIINPEAGHGKGRKYLDRILTLLQNRGIEFDVAISEYHEHAIELAENTELDQYDAMIAAGGDGTVYQVLNGIMRRPEAKKPPLGIIPIGTGNAGSWDTTGVRTLDEAIDVILAGKKRKVDIGTFLMDHAMYYFLNVIGVGFVADVGQIAVKFKWMGEVAYTLGVLWETAFLKSHRMRFEFDSQELELDGTFVEFCNTRYTAADMLMAPDASTEDGLIDMVICKSMNRRTLLKAFPRVFKGTHTELPEIDVYKISSVKLWTEEPKVLIPDGEIFGRTPIEVGVIPGGLEIFYKATEEA